MNCGAEIVPLKVVDTPTERCWQRAQFLALREELSDSLQPKDGIE
jgi:hypothetical protein